MRQLQWSLPLFGWQYELQWYDYNGVLRATSRTGMEYVTIQCVQYTDCDPTWVVRVRAGRNFWVCGRDKSLKKAILFCEQEVVDIEACFRVVRGKKERSPEITAMRGRNKHDRTRRTR